MPKLEIFVDLPTLPEQQEIVRPIEALFALVDRFKARIANAPKTIERLAPATTKPKRGPRTKSTSA